MWEFGKSHDFLEMLLFRDILEFCTYNRIFNYYRKVWFASYKSKCTYFQLHDLSSLSCNLNLQQAHSTHGTYYTFIARTTQKDNQVYE